MASCYVEFEIGNDERFQALARVFDEIRKDKARGWFRDVEGWTVLFDDRALSHFRKPADNETEAWHKHSWSLDSCLDAIANSDCEWVTLTRIGGMVGRLEFEPFGFPYGGTECMHALIEAFDHRVVGGKDV